MRYPPQSNATHLPAPPQGWSLCWPSPYEGKVARAKRVTEGGMQRSSDILHFALCILHSLISPTNYNLYLFPTTTGGFVAVLQAAFLRWEEFVDRELDSSECVTRILVVTGTFLVRNTEIVCWNKHLHISFKLYDCEDTKSDCNCLFRLVIIAVEISVEATAYASRKS